MKKRAYTTKRNKEDPTNHLLQPGQPPGTRATGSMRGKKKRGAGALDSHTVVATNPFDDDPIHHHSHHVAHVCPPQGPPLGHPLQAVTPLAGHHYHQAHNQHLQYPPGAQPLGSMMQQGGMQMHPQHAQNPHFHHQHAQQHPQHPHAHPHHHPQHHQPYPPLMSPGPPGPPLAGAYATMPMHPQGPGGYQPLASPSPNQQLYHPHQALTPTQQQQQLHHQQHHPQPGHHYGGPLAPVQAQPLQQPSPFDAMQPPQGQAARVPPIQQQQQGYQQLPTPPHHMIGNGSSPHAAYVGAAPPGYQSYASPPIQQQAPPPPIANPNQAAQQMAPVGGMMPPLPPGSASPAGSVHSGGMHLTPMSAPPDMASPVPYTPQAPSSMLQPQHQMPPPPPQQQQQAPPSPAYCGHCGEPIYDSHESRIMCRAGCESYYHQTCSGLTELACDMLKAEPSAEWACNRCISSDPKIPVVRTINHHGNNNNISGTATANHQAAPQPLPPHLVDDARQAPIQWA